ncbi:MAG: ATP-binding cassette domain-containing protein, partial [Chloroflexota bacterium]|nr:ATP-binding cassette domain-containing protein [Chloroflexota bacterium]
MAAEAPRGGETLVGSAPEGTGAPILQIREIDAAYGKVQILHGVSLDLYPGEVVSVIGPNGAGKSTVLKAVMGILTPIAGEILFAGQPIGGLRTDL